MLRRGHLGLRKHCRVKLDKPAFVILDLDCSRIECSAGDISEGGLLERGHLSNPTTVFPSAVRRWKSPA